MNSDRLYKAIQFATKAHEGQKRKGKNPAPYICHPVFVGMELLKLGYDEDTVVAGILHDTIEDGFPSFERDAVRNMIIKDFGNRVLSLVDAVTEPKDPNMTKEEKRKTWESRKVEHLERLRSSPPEARAIACIDMYANMLDLKRTIEDERHDALSYFNVGLKKKIEHSMYAINLFGMDKDSLHSRLIIEIKDTLKAIQELIRYEK